MKQLNRLLRKVLGIPSPRVSASEAIRIARNHAGGHEISVQPEIIEGIRNWVILLDPDFRPCRRVVVDNQTGEIKKFISLTR